jgi:hypothetical protein
MVDGTRGVNTTPQKAAAETNFTMQRLRRQALWGCAAAAALLIAIISGRGSVGAQKAPINLASTNSASPPSLQSQAAGKAGNLAASRSIDVELATRQLTQSVHALTEDRDRIMTRLAAVEHNINDLTGSITQQVQAAKQATAQPVTAWTNDEAPVPMIPASIPSAVAWGAPPATDLASPLAPTSSTPVAEKSPSKTITAGDSSAYGVDIGGASSIRGLHARWAEIRSAHAEIFEGLKPIVTLRDNPRSNRTELRLVVGPFANAGEAAQLCASLNAFRLTCQPAMFDGRQLALE